MVIAVQNSGLPIHLLHIEILCSETCIVNTTRIVHGKYCNVLDERSILSQTLTGLFVDINPIFPVWIDTSTNCVYLYEPTDF